MITSVATIRATPCPPFVRLLRRHPLVAYFALAYLGSWLVLAPAALGQGEYGFGLLPFAVSDGITFIISMLAVYTGPLTAAMLVTAAVDGRAGLQQLLARVGNWRVAPRWYLAALLAPLMLWLILYSLLLHGAPLVILARGWLPLLTAFLSNVALGLLLPALGEETGWRGFALPRLQARYGPLRATLLLGTLHSLWHLPAFFTPMLGPFVPLRFATFVLTGVAGAFLFTWVVNGARGSALPAILLHAALNAAATLVGRLIPADAPLPDWSASLDVNGWLNVLAFGAAALLLTALTKGRLAYRPDHVAPTWTACVPEGTRELRRTPSRQ